MNMGAGQLGSEPKELIGTIKLPKNLALLKDRLPASQYDEDKDLLQLQAFAQ